MNLFVGLIIGLGVGIVLQRGRVCTNTIFRNLTIIRNGEMFTIIVVSVSTMVIGYQLLAFLPNSTFESNPISFSWLFLPIGSLIFGFGTVIAGGCAGGVCYRVGEGNSKALLALIGYIGGIGILAVGPFASIFERLNTNTNILIDGKIPSLDLFFPRIVWTFFALILLIIFIGYYLNLQRKDNIKLNHLLPRWTPIVSGLFIGLLGIWAKYDRGFSLSTIDGVGNIVESLISFQMFNWAGFFIIGLIFGAFLSSLNISEFKIKIPNRPETFRYLFGGFILGFGAMLASGCNFGHIFGGIPELGLSSLIALPLMIIGNGIGSIIFYKQMNNPLPVSTPN